MRTSARQLKNVEVPDDVCARVAADRRAPRAPLDEARRAGYSAVLLDTLYDMEAARELYASLGFQEIPPYYFSPLPGAHYLKAELL